MLSFGDKNQVLIPLEEISLLRNPVRGPMSFLSYRNHYSGCVRK